MKNTEKKDRKKINFKAFLTKVFVENIELKIAALVVSVIFWLLSGYFFAI